MSSTQTEQPPRERILQAVLELLDSGGVEAVSTRAITARASVQAPAIYRIFGDKDGLLGAAAERAYTDWVETKSRRRENDDPVEELRAGWDEAIRFGVEHPAVYRITNARAEEGQSIQFGRRLLREKLDRTARDGRLTVSPERAETLMHATGRGITLALIDTPPAKRDMTVSLLAREAVIGAITSDAPIGDKPTLRVAALTVQALLTDSDALGPEERQLMNVWLGRVASA